MRKNHFLSLILILIFITAFPLEVQDYRVKISGSGFISRAKGARWVVFNDGPDVFAKNAATGNIDVSGTNASYVINTVLNMLTPGRTWKEKISLEGNFTLTNTIKVPSYTVLEIYGTLRLASNSFCSLIENQNQKLGNVYIDIIGGHLDGNRINNDWNNPITNAGSNIYFEKVSHGIISNIESFEAHTRGVALNNCFNGTVVNSYVHDNGRYNSVNEAYDNIAVAYGSNNRVIGTVFNMSYRDGLVLYGTKDFIVTSSYFGKTPETSYDGHGVGGAHIMIDHGSENITIINSTFFDWNDNSIVISDASNRLIRIINNTFDAPGGLHAQGGVAAIRVGADALQVSIINNTLTNGYQNGIYLYNVVGAVIDGNSVANFRRSGIVLIASSYNNITRNIVLNSAIYAGDGIREESTSDYNTILNCTSRNSGNNIIVVGLHTTVHQSWNGTTWIP